MIRVLPIDAWQEDGIAYLVFDLAPPRGAVTRGEQHLAQAIFALDAASGVVLAARSLDPGWASGTVVVTDVLAPSSGVASVRM